VRAKYEESSDWAANGTQTRRLYTCNKLPCRCIIARPVFSQWTKSLLENGRLWDLNQIIIDSGGSDRNRP